MSRFKHLLTFTLGLLTSLSVETFAGEYSSRPDVVAFAQEMQDIHGLSKKDVLDTLGRAERKQTILDAISRPAETKLEWKAYRKIFMTDARVDGGTRFWSEHEQELADISAKYQVNPEIIVAIIGVETSYGRNTGSYRVVDALSTLAFDYPPRAAFFRKELREFLLLAKEQNQDPLTLTGSYAGAMGYGQFMPSSYRAFAVDYDQDGFADIWHNTRDAIASVAHYFQKHGWIHDDPVLARAHTVRDFDPALAKNALKPDMTLLDLAGIGVTPVIGDLEADRMATLLKQEGEFGREYWLGFDNFYAITRYNHSSMYAMAAHQLAEAIKTRHDTQHPAVKPAK
jgi:membrane-bound lytic murein transglycosylase B